MPPFFFFFFPQSFLNLLLILFLVKLRAVNQQEQWLSQLQETSWCLHMSCRPSEMYLMSSCLLVLTVQCLEMTTKRKLIGRLVPCRCFRGEEEVISVLDYSHCSLQQVPKEIFSFERTLEELYLDANQIEELPKVALMHMFTSFYVVLPFYQKYILSLSPLELLNIFNYYIEYIEYPIRIYVTQFGYSLRAI